MSGLRLVVLKWMLRALPYPLPCPNRDQRSGDDAVSSAMGGTGETASGPRHEEMGMRSRQKWPSPLRVSD